MEIKISTTKNGQPRAYRYSRRQMRWFPISLDAALVAVATGAARVVKAAA
jgi:hypothetical protein